MKSAKKSLFKHKVRIWPTVRQGFWKIDCRCGWNGKISAMVIGNRTGANTELMRQFRLHLPDADLSAYLLVDQRPTAFDENDNPIANGTFLMPEETPVDLIRHECDGGMYFGYIASGAGEARLPIGEIRTHDGRIFRAE